jgi:hypothetical protein
MNQGKFSSQTFVIAIICTLFFSNNIETLAVTQDSSTLRPPPQRPKHYTINPGLGTSQQFPADRNNDSGYQCPDGSILTDVKESEKEKVLVVNKGGVSLNWGRHCLGYLGIEYCVDFNFGEFYALTDPTVPLITNHWGSVTSKSPALNFRCKKMEWLPTES